ncbi:MULTISPECIES: putative metal-binding motif-containing protein [unclassified Corallococcus]|uniref:putative metal-binding motif-containing protein n=1 Tax=unclassified Corallococcus TaxID=2685029 RepID=UPI001A8DE32E|nr:MULTISPECIES: putative metal-binding motif-containing protein [unclassified Corallococcus]MBN9687225.1 putative metal-binding motif-containing protein [Corallococcus sp. NCSPR001]WAS88947.1 putative metal-binding motif-containing protein [Corallococcus sp. NCRR]
MHSRMMSLGPVSLVMALLLAGCDSSTKPPEPVPDAGTQVDAGVTDDAGTPDSGVAEALPCEKTQGVCAGAKRAMVDGAYEPVCTARSYGENYEATETRCDGLDNDCDGVTDPATWTDVAPLKWAPYERSVDSLPVAGGFLMVYVDSPEWIEVLRFDESLNLQGTSRIPQGPDFSHVTDAQLVRTVRGPALYFTALHVKTGTPAEGRLVQLDEQGAPIGSPGGVVLFEQPTAFLFARVAASVDGQRISVVWAPGITGVRQVQGMLVDPAGQVLVPPRVIFQSDSPELYSPRVLAMGDGNFLVTASEGVGTFDDNHIRLRRHDRELGLVGDERRLAVAYRAVPKLLMMPAKEGGEEPVMLYREPDGHTPRLHEVRHLFAGGMPVTLTSAAWSESSVLGATMTSRGLQLAWTSMGHVPVPGQESGFIYDGRLWGMSPSGVVTDWTPGPAPMPLHRNGEWVLLHELPDRWMGALMMTATVSPESYTLHSLRYCAP